MSAVEKDSYRYLVAFFFKNSGISGLHSAISRRRHCTMNSKSADNLMVLYMGLNGSLQRRNPKTPILLIN